MESISYIKHLEVVSDFISYQPVLIVNNSVQYLRAINILSDGKVIDKVNLGRPYQEYNKLDTGKIVKKYLLEKIKPKATDKKKETKNTRYKKRTPTPQDKDARNKAAESLLTNLGCNYS